MAEAPPNTKFRSITYNGVTFDASAPRSSDREGKKYMRYVRYDGKTKVVHWGQPGVDMQRDEPGRRRAYNARHNCDDAKDPFSPKFQACWHWNTTKSAQRVLQASKAASRKNDKRDGFEPPDDVVNKELYKKIYRRIKRDVEKDGRDWGAYDSGQLVQQYKREGGKYRGRKKSLYARIRQTSKSLSDWFDKEDWVDIGSKDEDGNFKPCSSGRKDPMCRPRSEAEKLTQAEIDRLVRRKRRVGGVGERIDADPGDLRRKDS